MTSKAATQNVHEFEYENLFSSDDEVYTLQCPDFVSDYTIKELFRNSSANKNECEHVEKEESLNVVVLGSENKCVSLVCPTQSNRSKITRVPLSGHLVISRSINNLCKTKENSLLAKDKKIVLSTLTQEKNQRHPLLGMNWKPHMDVARKAVCFQEGLPKGTCEKRKPRTKSKDRKKRKPSLSIQ